MEHPYSKDKADNHTDSYFPWESIRAQYFNKGKKIVEFDTNKKVVDAEVSDSSKHKTDADRDYYWPLGEIGLEEAQL